MICGLRLTADKAKSRVRGKAGQTKNKGTREKHREKQLATLGYWLGLVCTVLALIFRGPGAIHIVLPRMGTAGGNAISYLSFFHGAVLFSLLGIASACRTEKS